MTDKNERKRRREFKIGDVIDVSMNIEFQIPPEDEGKSVIDTSDYDRNYEISYFFPRNLDSLSFSLTVEAGYIPSFFDDIAKYIKEYFIEDVEEIAEYELFDVDNIGDPQTACIRVKRLK